MKIAPLFIVGCPRTGSTTQQNLLNSYTNFAIMPETHILSVWYLRKDFSRYIKEEIGSIDNDEQKKKLVDLMFSKKLFGQFWEYIEKQNICRDILEKEIGKNEKLSIKDVFEAILVAYMISNNKSRSGAKFPVHVKYANRLFEWFPDCLIIHTVRDPRGIYSSQYYKHGGGGNNKLKNIYIAILQFFHISINYNQAARVHRQLKNNKNYRLFKYENLVSEPKQYFKNWCSFINIEYNSKLLKSEVPVNSSYSEIREKGFGYQASAINAWKKKIPKIVSILLVVVNYRAMKEFNYL